MYRLKVCGFQLCSDDFLHREETGTVEALPYLHRICCLMAAGGLKSAQNM